MTFSFMTYANPNFNSAISLIANSQVLQNKVYKHQAKKFIMVDIILLFIKTALLCLWFLDSACT